MSLLSSIFGNVIVEITSADPEQFLAAASSNGLRLSHIQKHTELTYTFTVSRATHPALSALCEKHGATLKVLRRSGLYWTIKQAAKRPVLVCGLIFLFLFALFLPTRIYFVNIQGNTIIPTRKILYAAYENGISFGASRRAVRSEKVKNALLSSLPELEWVGVNTSGCVANISVRERSDADAPETHHAVSHITASQDGYILSMTVTNGNPLCTPGQQVQKGQVLVSGYTDCGLYIRAEASEAEIYAQTNRHLEVITPSQPQIRAKETRRKRKYSLLLGKKRINLWKGSGILDSSCGRIYEEKYATLPGGFQLPLALCIEEYVFYDTQVGSCQNQNELSSFAFKYLTQHMTAGIILNREEQFYSEEGVLRLVGDYTCQEMIGRVQQEQIGD